MPGVSAVLFDKKTPKDAQATIRVPKALKSSVERISKDSVTSKNEVWGRLVERGYSDHQWLEKNKAAVDAFKAEHSLGNAEVMERILEDWLHLRGNPKKK